MIINNRCGNFCTMLTSLSSVTLASGDYEVMEDKHNNLHLKMYTNSITKCDVHSPAISILAESMVANGVRVCKENRHPVVRPENMNILPIQ